MSSFNHNKQTTGSEWSDHKLSHVKNTSFASSLQSRVYHTYKKNAHVKKHSYLSCKNHNCDSVLIYDTKKEKEELVLGCVKRGKKYYIHSLYTLLYNLVLHTVLSIIYLECESLFRRIHQTYICLTHLAAFLFGF